MLISAAQPRAMIDALTKEMRMMKGEEKGKLGNVNLRYEIT
jgi:hypothetical protein